MTAVVIAEASNPHIATHIAVQEGLRVYYWGRASRNWPIQIASDVTETEYG